MQTEVQTEVMLVRTGVISNYELLLVTFNQKAAGALGKLHQCFQTHIARIKHGLVLDLEVVQFMGEALDRGCVWLVRK